MPPRASCRSPFISNKRYLKLVEPRLATSIFILRSFSPSRHPTEGRARALGLPQRASRVACANPLAQVSLNQSLGRTRDDMAGGKFANLLGCAGAGFDRRANAAD